MDREFNVGDFVRIVDKRIRDTGSASMYGTFGQIGVIERVHPNYIKVVNVRFINPNKYQTRGIGIALCRIEKI